VDGALLGAIAPIWLRNLPRPKFGGTDEPSEEFGGKPGVGFADPFGGGNEADQAEHRSWDKGIEYNGDGFLLVVGVAALHDLLGEFDEAVIAGGAGFAAEGFSHFVGEEADEEAIEPVVLVFGGGGRPGHGWGWRIEPYERVSSDFNEVVRNSYLKCCRRYERVTLLDNNQSDEISVATIVNRIVRQLEEK
jgi:hypothetical protein